MDLQHEHAAALYYHIAGDAIECAVKETDEFRLAEYVCTAMVFSALTLEAYINQQYAAHNETAKIDLRRFEVREKWKMLPLLLGSKKTFDPGTMPFQTLHELISLRDTLVHFTRTTISGGRKPKENFSVVVKDIGRAKTCFACIPAMIHALKDLTSGKTDVPDFLHGARYLSTIFVDASISLEFRGAGEIDNPNLSVP